MTITVSVLIALASGLLLGSWILAAAVRRADDGYEDAIGFHIGKAPALPLALFRPAMAAALAPAPGMSAAPFAPAHSSTDTSTQSVTIFVSSNSRSPGPLYRRHHRRGGSAAPFPVQSASPFPVQSASPFEISCAATRDRANQAGSNPPMPLGAKSAFGSGSNR